MNKQLEKSDEEFEIDFEEETRRIKTEKLLLGKKPTVFWEEEKNE